MRQTIWSLVFAAAATPALLVGACSSDDSIVSTPPDASADHTVPDTGDAGNVLLSRGEYLVKTVAGCNDCHTPRNADGSPNMARFLAGVDCFIGTDKSGDASTAPGPGCLSSRNLTNDTTGLQKLTDQEIKDLFMKGIKPLGRGYLNNAMPYWVYANFTDDDASAIVAYLRTVPAVTHAVKEAQDPWLNPAPTPLLDLSTVFAPSKDGNPDYDSQMRGRYLAATAAACIECHTQETSPGVFDRSKWFAGHRVFDAASLGLPVGDAGFPAQIYSANLTSDATGLAGYTIEQIVRALKHGLDDQGKGVCPPMPSGPGGPFVNLTDNDATDIARYLKVLPPIVNERPNCIAPVP